MTLTLPRKKAIYGFLCFLLSFGLYYYYYHLPLSDSWILQRAAWLTPSRLNAVYYVISFYAAAWLLDKKPLLRKTLPVYSAMACAITVGGIALSTGLLLDVFLLLFHMAFAPVFISSLYWMRALIKNYFITSLVAIRLFQTVLLILLGPNRVQEALIYILLGLSLLLFFLMRKLPEPDNEIYSLEVFHEKIRRHWIMVVLFLFQFVYNTQIAIIFWTNIEIEKNLIKQIPVLLTAGIVYLAYAVLLDRKGWKFVYFLTCSFSGLFLLALLIPTSSEMIRMLIPISDISSNGLEMIVLTAPFIFFVNKKGYRLYAMGFLLLQLLFEVPQFVAESLMNSSVGRLMTGAAIINSLVLIGLCIVLCYQKSKAQAEEEKELIMDSLAKSEDLPYETYRLSNREIQVAELLIRAKSRDEIGLELGLSRGTINTYCSSLYKKTGCSSQVELISKLTLKKKSKIQ